SSRGTSRTGTRRKAARTRSDRPYRDDADRYRPRATMTISRTVETIIKTRKRPMNVVCASSARLPSQDASREPSGASRARQASPGRESASSEGPVAVGGNQIQGGNRHRRALPADDEALRPLQPPGHGPPAALARGETGPRPKLEGIGPGRGDLKYRREDGLEAHRFLRPDRVQQDAASNLSLASAGHA